MKFDAEGQEFAKILRSLEQNAFLTCSWRFLRYNKSEQLEFKLEKILGFRNTQEKLEKGWASEIDWIELIKKNIKSLSCFT